MMKRAMYGVFTAVLAVGVVSSGCTSTGRFSGGMASTIAGAGLLVAVHNDSPGGSSDGGSGVSPRDARDTLGRGLGIALVAVGIALLIPDMRDPSKTAPAPAAPVPGAASTAPARIAPDREVRVTVPPLR
jgi:hypothetical protein